MPPQNRIPIFSSSFRVQDSNLLDNTATGQPLKTYDNFNLINQSI